MGRMRRRAKTVHRGVLISLAVCLSTVAPVHSQTDAHPQTLYDCTTLTDPAELQQCITENQGGRKIRGKLSTGVKPPDAPIYQNTENPNRKIAPLPEGPP